MISLVSCGRNKIIIGFLLFLNYTFRCESLELNILFINEFENEEANQAVQSARDYVNENPSFDLEINITQVDGARKRPKTFLKKLCEVYSDAVENGQPPHLVLDTTKTPVISEIAKSFTAALGLPTISAGFGKNTDIYQWRNIDMEKRKYLLQIMPPSDLIPDVIRSIVIYMNMSDAAILFDDSFVMDHKYKALLANMKTRYVMTELEDVEQIDRLNKLNYRNFFVLGRLASIKPILENIGAEYFERNYAWHIITQDLGNLSCCCGSNNMMLMRPKHSLENGYIEDKGSGAKYTDIASVFYFDLTLRTFLTAKEMISTNNWPENLDYQTCNNYTGPTSLNRPIVDLKSFFVNVSKSATYGEFSFSRNDAVFNGHSTMKFDMEIFSVSGHNGIDCKEQSLGKWTAGFTPTLQIASDTQLIELKAKKFYRVGTIVKPPFIIRDSDAPRGYRGQNIDLMDEIARRLNFDYILEEYEEHGMMATDGSFHGIIEKLMNKELDIGLGTMQIMAERETVVDFTIPYWESVGYHIVMGHMKPKSQFFKFVVVLDVDVWSCVFGAFFLTSSLIFLFERYSPYSYHNNREKYEDDDEKKEFTIRECFWFTMTSITPQGGGEAPKNLSGRLVAATWWLFGFIVLASYTANLAAYLTLSRLEKPMRDMDDLVKQFKTVYAPVAGSEIMTYFQRMADIEGIFYEAWKDMSLNDSLNVVQRSALAVWDYPVSDKYTKMWQAMQEAPPPSTLEEGVLRIISSGGHRFALIADTDEIKWSMMWYCGLQTLGSVFSKKPYAIAVQKGSPLRDEINSALLRILDERFIDEMKIKYWTKRKKCPKIYDKQDGITVGNMGGVFLIVGIGIVVTLVTLIGEIIWFMWKRASKMPIIVPPEKLGDDVDFNGVGHAANPFPMADIQ